MADSNIYFTGEKLKQYRSDDVMEIDYNKTEDGLDEIPMRDGGMVLMAMSEGVANDPFIRLFWYATIDGSDPTPDNYLCKTGALEKKSGGVFKPYMVFTSFLSATYFSLPYPDTPDRRYTVKHAIIGEDGIYRSEIHEVKFRFRYMPPNWLENQKRVVSRTPKGVDDLYRNKIYVVTANSDDDLKNVKEGDGVLIGEHVGMVSYTPEGDLSKMYVYETGERGVMSAFTRLSDNSTVDVGVKEPEDGVESGKFELGEPYIFHNGDRSEFREDVWLNTEEVALDFPTWTGEDKAPSCRWHFTFGGSEPSDTNYAYRSGSLSRIAGSSRYNPMVYLTLTGSGYETNSLVNVPLPPSKNGLLVGAAILDDEGNNLSGTKVIKIKPRYCAPSRTANSIASNSQSDSDGKRRNRIYKVTASSRDALKSIKDGDGELVGESGVLFYIGNIDNPDTTYFYETGESGRMSPFLNWGTEEVIDPDTYTGGDDGKPKEGKTPTPTISPAGGSYAGSVAVTIRCSEPTATIYYTTDGSDPKSSRNPKTYSAPITLTETATVKAIAYSEAYSEPTSDTATEAYTITAPSPSSKAPRDSDSNNGIYVRDVRYSGGTDTLRAAYTLPSVKTTDTEALITWGYHIDGTPEDLGKDGTKCKVTDTHITIRIPFTHNGKTYTLEKRIPVTCIVQGSDFKADAIDIIDAWAVCTLENEFKVHVRARVRHTTETQVGILSDLSNYDLSGTTTMGDFMCWKDGSEFGYDGIITSDYSGSTQPANQVRLTLINTGTGFELDHHVIQVTFEAGSIFEVRDDAIRMAVQETKEITDGLDKKISELSITADGISSTVKDIKDTVDGHTEDISSLRQTASSITMTVQSMEDDMVKKSEIEQLADSITMNVYNEIGENTGINIVDGTITLDAQKTVVTGDLQLNDGLTFYDADGNPTVNVEGRDIGKYPDQANGSIYFRYLNEEDSAAAGFGYTTRKDPIGEYSSGDTITYHMVSASAMYAISGEEYFGKPYDTGLTQTCQIQLFLGDSETPFATRTVTLTGAEGTPVKKAQGSPLAEFTVTGSGVVYARYTVTTPTASGLRGSMYRQVNCQIGTSSANTVRIGKGGISMSHAANYLTYLGGEDTVLRKGNSGIRIGKFGSRQAVPQVAMSNYYSSSGDFTDHPDNISGNMRLYWTPADNYIFHTAAMDCCDVYNSPVSGYSTSDVYNARISEDKLCGELWLDALFHGATDLKTRMVNILLPPTQRQLVIDGKAVTHSLPEGYRVRIRNMGFSGTLYVRPNLMDGYSSVPAIFHLPNNTTGNSHSISTRYSVMDYTYYGTYTDASQGPVQMWYVTEHNGA